MPELKCEQEWGDRSALQSCACKYACELAIAAAVPARASQGLHMCARVCPAYRVKGEGGAHLSCSQQLVDRRQPCSQREPPVRARYRGWRRLFFAFPAGILDFHPLSSSDAHPGSVLSDRKPFRDTIGRVAAKREPARRLQPLVRMPNVKSGENDRNFLTLLQYL